MTLLDYLKSIDPKYGLWDHQKRFLEVMDRAQALHPCTKDHSQDTPPTHVPRCYPRDSSGRMKGT